jgi:hypothetical protein
LTRDAHDICSCTAGDEEVNVNGTIECHTPCGSNEERTSSSDPTCVCIAGYEALTTSDGTCMEECHERLVRDSTDACGCLDPTHV